MFEPLGIGPLPGPGTVAEFAAALVVLVAGDPPVGPVPHRRRGRRRPPRAALGPSRPRRAAASGGPCCGPACDWAAAHGYPELTLATYRDVPWNGPFYASEGFVEVGPVDDWLVAHGLRARGAGHGPLRRPRPDAPAPVSSA